MPGQDQFDAIVVGAGPAGLTAALALSNAGLSVALAGRRVVNDSRTTALLMGSVTTLDALGVWDRCRAQAAPLSRMRLVDDTGRLVRAPEVMFKADEIDFDAFGYNIQNRDLVAALEARTQEMPSLRRIEDEIQSVAAGEKNATVVTKTGETFRASLVVGADGRNSICRTAAGIQTETKLYPQTALALSFSQTRPHHDTSTEFHTPSGPFTLVPLPGNRSSLVWVVDPDTAAHMLALDDDNLSDEIERRSHSILGKIKVEAGRGAFPLSIATAKAFAASRIALVGEAAHVMPPIGAQGLNLGLRDAAAIAEIAAEVHRTGGDIGDPETLARYGRERRSDVTRRMTAVDWLNRSLLTDFLPAQTARGLALYLLDKIGPLRRTVMREGVAPSL